jgi:type II secretory pathway pseudopilin PulG
VFVVSRRRLLVILLIGALLAVGLLFLGRATVDTAAARRSGQANARLDGYFDGLRVGAAQGRQQGRAEQELGNLPAGSTAAAKRAFDDGYVAGTNDVFAGYDGGWATGVPYVITIELGTGDIVYRIVDRDRIEPGVAYFLCASGHGLCHTPRH